MTTESNQLVAQARSGDAAAFARLLRAHERAARGYAYGRLRDYQAAQDAVQEAALAAFQALDRLRDPARFGSWFFGIVRNQCHRILRRRDLAPLGSGDDLASSRAAPSEKAVRDEQRLWAVGAVWRLPPALRDVASLYYLEGCSQRETAGFLDLAVSTVNNRLHKARTLMRDQGVHMPAATTPPASHPVIGTVVSADGAIVDVRFDEDVRPSPFDALALPGQPPALRVVQHLDDGVARCLRMHEGEALEPGVRVRNATTVGGSYRAPVCAWMDVGPVLSLLAPDRATDRIFETGIQSVDLFSPLPARGTVALFGTEGTGKMVLTTELGRRLATRPDAPTLVYLGARTEPALVRDLQDGETWPSVADGGPDLIWIPTDHASDFVCASAGEPFGAALYCTPLLAIQGLWPAVDPLHSQSAVPLEAEQADIAERARELLETTRRHVIDARLLELMTCRAYAAAREYLSESVESRVSSLPAPTRAQVERGRRLEAYLTTPFEGAMDFEPGADRVPLQTTLRDVASILDGACDDTPLDTLRYAGALPS